MFSLFVTRGMPQARIIEIGIVHSKEAKPLFTSFVNASPDFCKLLLYQLHDRMNLPNGCFYGFHSSIGCLFPFCILPVIEGFAYN